MNGSFYRVSCAGPKEEHSDEQDLYLPLYLPVPPPVDPYRIPERYGEVLEERIIPLVEKDDPSNGGVVIDLYI